MQITCTTQAAPGRVNEDTALCGPDWAVVLDGATAPGGVDSGCVHPVTWLVRQLGAALTRRLITGGKTLPGVLGDAIGEVCLAHARTCDLGNPDSPSSTVSIVRVQGDTLEYLVLADSPVVVRAPDRTLTVISDDRLAHLPGGRPYSLGLVRSLRNKPGGFWVASTDPEAARWAVTGSVPYAAGTGIGMFTDGVSRLVEFYGYDWEQVFTMLETGGPAALIALVRSLERDQPIGSGKRHDDATAVLLDTGGAAGGLAVADRHVTRAGVPAYGRSPNVA